MGRRATQNSLRPWQNTTKAHHTGKTNVIRLRGIRVIRGRIHQRGVHWVGRAGMLGRPFVHGIGIARAKAEATGLATVSKKRAANVPSAVASVIEKCTASMAKYNQGTPHRKNERDPLAWDSCDSGSNASTWGSLGGPGRNARATCLYTALGLPGLKPRLRVWRRRQKSPGC
jgi:hypothetical protein